MTNFKRILLTGVALSLPALAMPLAAASGMARAGRLRATPVSRMRLKLVM